MKNPNDIFRLCWMDGVYRGGIMTFTDNIETQWGDDWNDFPADCNAEPPYEDDKHHLRYLAFHGCETMDNTDVMSRDSMENIIRYHMPFLATMYRDCEKREIRAGMTWNEVVELLKKDRAMYAELRYGESL